jgi:hypothetical protein
MKMDPVPNWRPAIPVLRRIKDQANEDRGGQNTALAALMEQLFPHAVPQAFMGRERRWLFMEISSHYQWFRRAL